MTIGFCLIMLTPVIHWYMTDTEIQIGPVRSDDNFKSHNYYAKKIAIGWMWEPFRGMYLMALKPIASINGYRMGGQYNNGDSEYLKENNDASNQSVK
jgi:hypothetical protein